MAIYKISEVLDRLFEMRQDNILYADICEIDGDADFPTFLNFDAIISDYECVNYETIESYPDVSEHDLTHCTISPDDNCYELTFTYQDIFTLYHAVTNALEYFKDCEKDPSYSSDILRNIKSSSVKCRNMQAKLFQIVRRFKERN